MAGEFARRVRARQLYLTHLSARFPDPGRRRPPVHPIDTFEFRLDRQRYREHVIEEIEEQATEAYGMPFGEVALVASDLLTVKIEPADPDEEPKFQ